MKTRICLVLMLALALTLIGATLTMARQAGAGRHAPPPRPKGPCDIYAAAGDSLRRRPQHHARAVRLLQRPALPGPAPVGRQDPGHRRRPARRVAGPGCGRIRQRGRAGRVLRQHVLLDHHHLRPIPQAQRPHPGAPRRIQRPGDGRVQQPPGRRHGADHDHGPQGLRRLHRARHGPPPERREGHRGRRPGGGAVLGHQRPSLQLRLLLRLRQRRDRQPRRRQRHDGDHLLRQRHRLVSRARRPVRGS